MKTINLHLSKLTIVSFLGLLLIISTSCGSTQNSSYSDTDGIYASSTPQKKTVEVSNNSNAYKQYFTSKELESKDLVVYDEYDETLDSTEVAQRSYSGWGENPSSVTVNVYDSGWDNWGMGWGMGWNSWYGLGWGWGWNNWYGPGWGWGWNNWYGPGWGWGYPAFGWGGYNPYNGYGYSYNASRRGSSAYYNGNRGTAYGRNNLTSNRYRTNGRYTTSGRNSVGTRNSNYTTRSTSGTRNQSGYSNSSRTTTRSSSPSTTTRSSSTPTRSSNYSSGGSRSSSGGGSYGGGGRSGGGGGRSGGGRG
jgi:hypothetical protein